MKRRRKLREVTEAPVVKPEAATSKSVGEKSGKKRKLKEALETPAVQSGAQTLKKLRKKSSKGSREEAGAGIAAFVEPARVKEEVVPKEAAPLSKAEQKARKAAKQLAKKKRKKQRKAEEQSAAAKDPSKSAAVNAEITSAKEATKAVAADPAVIRWQPPKKERHRESLTVFVGGFPFDNTEDGLQKHFEHCGEITKCVVPRNGEGKRTGIAYITFETMAGVEAACKLDRSDCGGRILMVNKVKAREKGDKGKGKGEGDNAKGTGQKGKGNSFEHEVSIRGLPFSTTAEQLRKDFEHCGEVANLKLLYNEEGKVRGSAFIAFKTRAGFEKALQLEGTDYGGRVIYVCASGDFGSKGKDGKGKGKGKGKA